MNHFEKVKEVIVQTLACDEDLVVETANIAEDLGADSLTMVELVMALEDTFGVSVPEEKTKEIKTVGDIVKLLD